LAILPPISRVVIRPPQKLFRSFLQKGRGTDYQAFGCVEDSELITDTLEWQLSGEECAQQNAYRRPHVAGRLTASLLSSLNVQAVNCSLKFFATNPHDVVRASFRCPGAAVINFYPAAWQTTSCKRGYPNPVCTFLCS